MPVKRASRATCLAALLAVLMALTGAPSEAAGTGDWPAYLLGPTHTSFKSAAGIITPGNAGSMGPAWVAPVKPDPPTKPGQPAATWLASPTVVGGRIYIGANTGVLYAYDLNTGARLWKTFLGFQPTMTCAGEGIVSTATVAAAPDTHLLTVYTAAGDGNLYAVNAADGTILWSSKIVDPGTTQNAGFPWSSPTVIGGRIYIGMSSNCDNPLIRGGLKEFDQASGDLLATYFTVPTGAKGGGIWSSAAATGRGSRIFVTTGNDDPNGTQSGDSFSVVRLDGHTLARQDLWTVPPAQLGVDSDFGGSPTVFQATLNGSPTQMVGACNKNGRYYALNTTNLAAGPIWQFQVGVQHRPHGQTGLCLSAAVWDGVHLFISGPQTTINGTTYPGSVREFNPATGTPVWETGLPLSVAGSPSMDGAGVIAVPTYDVTIGVNNAVYLINAGNGAILGTVASDPSQIFAQPVFAGKFLVVASRSAGLMAFTPGSP
jgi:outer membrane protein assembly factor BamB